MARHGVAVLGATGYTGRLCAAEAVRRGLPLTLAGRRPEALEALRARIGAPDARVVRVDVGQPHSLAALARDVDVLLTTVGPYLRFGGTVLDAAIFGGAHYLDVSGEVGFLDQVYAAGPRAASAGVALCPGAGFDGVPGDLLASLAADRVEGAPRRVRVAYHVADGGVSRGTATSALGIAARGGAAWRAGALRDEAVFAERWDAPFPDRTRTVVSVPLPEVVSVGRTTGAPEVRAYAAVPGAPLLQPAAAVGGLLLRLAARTPVWRVAEAVVARLPEGPGDAARTAARTTVLVEVTGADLTVGPVLATARVDDLYGATARAAVGVAERLLREGPPALGALTPTGAVGGDAPWLLARMGADWSLAAA